MWLNRKKRYVHCTTTNSRLGLRFNSFKSRSKPARLSSITSDPNVPDLAFISPQGHSNRNLAVEQTQKRYTPEFSSYPRRPLLTLDPERLEELQQPIADISDLALPQFTVRQIDRPCTGSNHVQKMGKPFFNMRYHPDSRKGKILFPPGTRGFLYYHQTSTPLAGEIRFRICDSAASFFSPESRDLMHDKDDCPWRIPLAFLAKSPTCQHLFDLIVSEGLVSREIANVFESSPIFPVDRNTVFIYDIMEPFVYTIGKPKHVVLVTPEGLSSIRITSNAFIQKVPTNKRKEEYVKVKPYSGSFMCFCLYLHQT